MDRHDGPCEKCGFGGSPAWIFRPDGLPTWICLQCGHTLTESDRAVSDRRRFQWLVRRINTKKDTRNSEIAALTKMGKAAIPTLQRVLELRGKSYSEAKASAITVLGNIGGDEAVYFILQAMRQQEKDALKYRKRIIPLVVGAVLTLVALFVILQITTGKGGANFASMGGMFSAIAAMGVGLSARKKAAETLAALKEPRVVGPLAMAYFDKETKKTAAPILVQMMPLVKETHVAEFDRDQKAAIVRLLSEDDPNLVLGALGIVELFGAQAELPPVQSLKNHESDVVRSKAEEVEATLLGRAATEADRSTLLRASTGEDTDAGTLLRAATDSEDPNTDQLLRRAGD